MAGGLTPDERWALIQKYGSIDNAIDVAAMASDELSELWQTRLSWPKQGDFWDVFWKLARPLLDLKTTATAVTPAVAEEIATPTRTTSRPRKRGVKGKWYPGESIELAVRQLRPTAKDPGRNKAAKNAHLSTRAVDTILDHMRAGRLGRAEEKGWLVIRGKLRATPKRIRLSNLETS